LRKLVLGYSVSALGLVALMLLPIATAEDLPVPVETQLPLLLKVLTFDRNLQETMGDELVIAVVYQKRFRQSLLIKEALERAAATTELTRVAGTPFRLAPVALDDPDLLEQSLIEVEADVLYIAPLRAIPISTVTDASRRLGVLTMTGVPDYINSGVSVAIEVARSRPRLVINLEAAEKEGADLSSRLLNLARVVGAESPS
jgi:hypothetical protein